MNEYSSECSCPYYILWQVVKKVILVPYFSSQFKVGAQAVLIAIVSGVYVQRQGKKHLKKRIVSWSVVVAWSQTPTPPGAMSTSAACNDLLSALISRSL